MHVSVTSVTDGCSYTQEEPLILWLLVNRMLQPRSMMNKASTKDLRRQMSDVVPS